MAWDNASFAKRRDKQLVDHQNRPRGIRSGLVIIASVNTVQNAVYEPCLKRYPRTLTSEEF